MLFCLIFRYFCNILYSMENTNIDVQAFWERLKQISSSRKILQKDYCEQLGFNVMSFRNKKAEGYLPTVEQLVKLSRLFGVSLDYLVTGTTVDENEKALLEQLDLYKSKLAQIGTIVTETISDSAGE